MATSEAVGHRHGMDGDSWIGAKLLGDGTVQVQIYNLLEYKMLGDTQQRGLNKLLSM